MTIETTFDCRRVLAALLAIATATVALRAGAADPPGEKVATARHFDVFVQKREEKPLAEGSKLLIFQVVVVARTQKHATQRFSRRVETINSDLRQAGAWEIADINGDGFDDYRYRSGATRGGCQTWEARRWDTQHERFEPGGMQLAKWLDSKGNAVKSCIGQP